MVGVDGAARVVTTGRATRAVAEKFIPLEEDWYLSPLERRFNVLISSK
jgi:hypothetical protein